MVDWGAAGSVSGRVGREGDAASGGGGSESSDCEDNGVDVELRRTMTGRVTSGVDGCGISTALLSLEVAVAKACFDRACSCTVFNTPSFSPRS